MSDLNKKVFIDPKLKIKEQAELLAEMKGYKRGTVSFNKAVHSILDERYKFSSIPWNHNPKTPNLNKKLWDEFDFIKDVNVFKTQQDQDTFKSAVTSLTNLFTKNVLNLKTKAGKDSVSSFDYPNMKSSNKEDRKKVSLEIVQNRYARLFVATIIIDALAPVYMIKKSEVEKFFREAFKEDINNIRLLMNKNSYGIFTKAVQENTRKILKQESILKRLFET